MKITYSILCVVLLFAVSTTVSGQTVFKSDSNDQVGVKVTVYNSNLGLVKDTRRVSLHVGEGELRFMDVASHIMPETVHIRSLNYPRAFVVREQNYEYDLMNATKLLDRYVGQRIKIIEWNKIQDRKDVVDAVLLSNNQGQIFEINNEIYLGHPGYKVLPKIPENLIAKPTLTWLYDNTQAMPHQVEVSYLTTHISWKADYILVLNKEDTSSDISGWVTLDNRSGAPYENAQLKLVAGEVHRVEKIPREKFYALEARKDAKTPQFKEKSFFEYHVYDLQRKTTIKDRKTKQIRLLEAKDAKVRNELIVRGIRSYFSRQYRTQDRREPVNVYIKFKNSKDNNLGMPLPAGIMRLYKEEDNGSQQFIGEDRIEHTPKDEEVKLKIGEAFDVVAERIQTDYRQVSTRLHESEWEITLKNHKEKEIEVGIVEPLLGNWSVISSTHPYEKADAFTIRFDIKIPKNEEVRVRYRIRVGL